MPVLYFAIVPFFGLSLWKIVVRGELCGEACSKLVDYYGVCVAHVTTLFALLASLISHNANGFVILGVLLGEFFVVGKLLANGQIGFHTKSKFFKGLLRGIPAGFVIIRFLLGFPH